MGVIVISSIVSRKGVPRRIFDLSPSKTLKSEGICPSARLALLSTHLEEIAEPSTLVAQTSTCSQYFSGTSFALRQLYSDPPSTRARRSWWERSPTRKVYDPAWEVFCSPHVFILGALRLFCWLFLCPCLLLYGCKGCAYSGAFKAAW